MCFTDIFHTLKNDLGCVCQVFSHDQQKHQLPNATKRDVTQLEVTPSVATSSHCFSNIAQKTTTIFCIDAMNVQSKLSKRARVILQTRVGGFDL